MSRSIGNDKILQDNLSEGLFYLVHPARSESSCDGFRWCSVRMRRTSLLLGPYPAGSTKKAGHGFNWTTTCLFFVLRPFCSEIQ